MATYKYDRDFQVEILKLLIQDDNILRTKIKSVRPEYFTSEDLRIICRSLVRYFREYNSRPTLAQIKAIITDDVTPAQYSHYADMVGMLYTSEIGGDPAFIESSLIEFSGSQAMVEACEKILDLLTDGEYGDLSKARQIIDEALLIGTKQDETIDVADYISDYDMYKKLIEDSGMYTNRIKTLIPSFDRITKGIGRGELGLLIGPPKIGKTTFMVNLGLGALASNHVVLHITIEAKKPDVVAKYASRITGMTVEDSLSNEAEFTTRVKNFSHLLRKNKLRTEFFKPGSLTSADIRILLNHLSVRYDFRPDLVIIDYADRMKVEQTNEAMGKLYDELIGMSADYNYATWTASQAGRQAMFKDMTEVEDVSASWLKIANADIVATLCQTKNEKRSNLVRLVPYISRRTGSFYAIQCMVDGPTCLVKELSYAEIDDKKEEDETRR